MFDSVKDQKLQSSLYDFHALPFDVLEESLKYIPNPTFISIGSGTAQFEYLIKTVLNKEVVCVDPTPMTFEKDLHLAKQNKNKNKSIIQAIKPSYGDINDIARRVLSTFNYAIIIWPYPDALTKKPYDYEALQKLNLDGFFVVYSPNGCSGTSNFVRCLKGRRQGLNKIVSVSTKKYICVASLTYKDILQGSNTNPFHRTRKMESYVRCSLLPRDFKSARHTVYHDNVVRQIQ